MLDVSPRRLVGKHVLAADGERIGRISDVYASTDGSGVTFATVATGLFGTSASFLPLAGAELRGDDVVVPYGKAQVRSAPRVDRDEDLSAEEEVRLYEHYGLLGAAAATPTAVEDDGAVEVTRSEERLEVRTERVEAGRARLRKHVVHETVVRTVPLTHDELRVVREPIAEGDVDPALVPRALHEQTYEVVLHAERPVVRKHVVPLERVRLDTVTVTGQQTVAEELRREAVEVDKGA